MIYSYINFEIEDNVGLIRLNRPDDGNALIPELANELLDAVIRCDEDSGIRAVVLTGSGKMFCAGGDLKVFASQGKDITRYARDTAETFHAVISRFNWMDAPVIGAINGTAAGGGLSLALTTDIAVAAESARFTMAYTRAGLTPDGGASYFLARIVGIRRAKEMVLLNPTLSAREALEWGLVNRVVADDKVVSTAFEIAHQLAKGPTRSFGESKRLILSGANCSLEAQMEKEALMIAKMAGGPEGREGITAFVEKRDPRFNDR
jgi:2-(1,2-epoxy-1,2-dihydrophenyl)acetyl-CoA isomerase